MRSPSELELAGALIVGIVLVHALVGQLIRAPVWAVLVVSAQLGVPAAVVKLGLADGLLNAGQAAAVIVAALASLGISAAGAEIAKRASPDASTGASVPRPRIGGRRAEPKQAGAPPGLP